MKKEKKAFKGWVDPMATPYQYKKGWNQKNIKSATMAEVGVRGNMTGRYDYLPLSGLKAVGG